MKVWELKAKLAGLPDNAEVQFSVDVLRPAQAPFHMHDWPLPAKARRRSAAGVMDRAPNKKPATSQPALRPYDWPLAARKRPTSDETISVPRPMPRLK